MARRILDGFRRHQTRFRTITQAARKRFEARDWAGAQADAENRLALYDRAVRETLGTVRVCAGEAVDDPAVWAGVKRAYAGLVDGTPVAELAHTFYNSITRKLFPTTTIDPDFEFVSLCPPEPVEVDPAIYRRFDPGAGFAACLRRVIDAVELDAPWADVERDVERMVRRLERSLAGRMDPQPVDAIEMLVPVFYRYTSAVLVGRLVIGDEHLPLVLALRQDDEGVAVDALLTGRDDVSVVFSFARSYFFVDTESPRELIWFLKTILPRKPIAELYISLGSDKHGKTELYRDLERLVARGTARFRIAPGAAGLVMLVFTLDDSHKVFKVIRDVFPYPKQTTRRHVMERYRLVFRHARVGRLIDAQQFEHLRFPRSMFDPPLLAELRDQAARTVAEEGDELVFAHLYVERKIRPLDLYLREAPIEDATHAVIDYGYAIKELAAANIFAGDFLLKNFGVTRHGRVVFYDYDELCLLTECRFRRMPEARHVEDEMADEPWFSVGPHDVFPEEFRRFLGLSEELIEVFLDYHEDLFSPVFWNELQARLAAGELVDVLPYPPSRRL